MIMIMSVFFVVLAVLKSCLRSDNGKNVWNCHLFLITEASAV